MKLEDRIVYDPTAYLANMEELLDNLKHFQLDSKYRNLLGDLFVERLTVWDREVRKRKEDPFTLVVCGDFKRGKSSFINALLGEDVVTTNVTTETVTLNRISYGLHSNEAILSGGKKITLTDEELQRDNLEQIIAQAKEPITQLHIKRPIELLKELTIIDTPGMGDALKDFDALVEGALRQADAVVYLFSVNYPLSQREQLFLKTAILPQRYTSLYIVGNFADTMRNEKELERMQTLSNDRIANLLPDQHVYLVSALDERCRQTDEGALNPRTTDLLHANFADLKAKMAALIQAKKDYVLPERMNRMIRLMLDELNMILKSLEAGIEMNSHDIQATVDQVNTQKLEESQKLLANNEKIDALILRMKQECKNWMSEVFDRLEADLDSLHECNREDITKFYTFFCIDTVQEALNRCVDFHTEKLLDAAEEISSELTYGLAKDTQPKTYQFQFSMDTKTWTKGDNVGFFASNFGSIFGDLGYLGGLALGGIMRSKEMQADKPKVIQGIRNQYPQFRASSEAAIEKTYGQMSVNAKHSLQEYHAEKIALAQEQVQQAALVARQSEERKAEIEAAIQNVRVHMEKLEHI